MRIAKPIRVTVSLLLLTAFAGISIPAHCAEPWPSQTSASAQSTTLSSLEAVLRAKARTLENSSDMRLAFQTFLSAHKLPPNSVSYSDFVLIRLLFEATRDAGFWNLHWAITDQPPNSDRIWKQWKAIHRPSVSAPTATAECDELSALHAFLVERAGVKSVGLL
jgi:hypothetical protein